MIIIIVLSCFFVNLFICAKGEMTVIDIEIRNTKCEVTNVNVPEGSPVELRVKSDVMLQQGRCFKNDFQTVINGRMKSWKQPKLNEDYIEFSLRKSNETIEGSWRCDIDLRAPNSFSKEMRYTNARMRGPSDLSYSITCIVVVTETKDKGWLIYFGIATGCLLLIIIIGTQTYFIFYFKGRVKQAEINYNLEKTMTNRNEDRGRYYPTPRQMKLTQLQGNKESGIYEDLDALNMKVTPKPDHMQSRTQALQPVNENSLPRPLVDKQLPRSLPSSSTNHTMRDHFKAMPSKVNINKRPPLPLPDDIYEEVELGPPDIAFASLPSRKKATEMKKITRSISTRPLSEKQTPMSPSKLITQVQNKAVTTNKFRFHASDLKSSLERDATSKTPVMSRQLNVNSTEKFGVILKPVVPPPPPVKPKPYRLAVIDQTVSEEDSSDEEWTYEPLRQYNTYGNKYS